MKHSKYIILLLQTLEHIISKMSDVRVETLERLLQIAVILERATEGVAKLPGNITVTLASFYFN